MVTSKRLQEIRRKPDFSRPEILELQEVLIACVEVFGSPGLCKS
jgi:hypothetical protein